MTWLRQVKALTPSVGDRCGECGEVLVLCVQCGISPRCVACAPYERLSERDYALYQALRARPEIGLLGGARLALAPATLIWADAVLTPAGTVRDLASLAGVVASSAFLAMGAAFSKMPTPRETPLCKLNDPAPVDRWVMVSFGAVLLQIALVSTGVVST